MTLLRPGVRRPCPQCEEPAAWFEASPPDRFGARGYWSDDPPVPLNPQLDSDVRPRRHDCDPALLREVMLRRGPQSPPFDMVPPKQAAPTPTTTPVTAPAQPQRPATAARPYQPARPGIPRQREGQ